jgi:hypothetical protein
MDEDMGDIDPEAREIPKIFFGVATNCGKNR